MKSVIAITSLAILTASAQPEHGVPLDRGTSPDKKHEVLLEAEKGTPRYLAYEFKGGDEQFPAFLIRQTKNGNVLARIPWMGDPGSDDRARREKSSVSWNPAGTAVIINTSERFYSHTAIWAIDDKTGTFKELVLPDYETLTGSVAPKAIDLRPRAHAKTSWTKDGDLVYTLILHPTPPPQTGDTNRHKITFKLQPDGLEVIKREPAEE